jgi:DNA polymerase I
VLVTQKNFDSFLTAFSKSPLQRAVDFETTGIWHWRSPHVSWYTPRIFSMQFSTLDNQDFYLDWEHSTDKLSDKHFEILNREIFSNPDAYWFDHNAKFELHQARNHGISFAGTVHCTKHIARVVNNREASLKLDDLSAKYLGAQKLDVKSFMDEQKLYTIVNKWGRAGTEEKWLHFDKLPLDMLIEYGVRDTQLCRDLGLLQLKTIEESCEKYYKNASVDLRAVVANEHKLTKTVFEMETVGVKVDIPYCIEAYNFECSEYDAAKKELDLIAKGKEVDWLSPQQLKSFFTELGVKSYKTTEKGAYSYDKDALEGMDHEAAKRILKYRYHYKRAHTYFENYVWLADVDGVIHPDFQNSGADTGRMSCWSPNLQNVPKRRDKDEQNYKVRRCFVPRSKEGFIFADFDYQAAEYRLMLDYARETVLVDKVASGYDVHQATADEIPELGGRDPAKNFNFGMLYGMGDKKIAETLGITNFKAKELKNRYFSRLPNVGTFINKVKDTVYHRGYIFNWLGRLLFYEKGGWPDGTSYKAPNGLIQSGVGDILKVAANNIAGRVLPGRKSRMLLLVHDAILFELHESELDLIDIIKKEMLAAYPPKVLHQDADVGYSRESWASLQDDIQIYQK